MLHGLAHHGLAVVQAVDGSGVDPLDALLHSKMCIRDSGKTVAAADMLVPGIGELIGGSQREEDYDKLATLNKEQGVSLKHRGIHLRL